MASIKKTTPTKTGAKKNTKTTPKQPVASKAVQQSKIQSFRPYRETTPFMTFQFTRESLYWLILSVLVLALGAWVMYLNARIQNIYDQIEMNTYLYELPSSPEVKDKTTNQ